MSVPLARQNLKAEELVIIVIIIIILIIIIMIIIIIIITMYNINYINNHNHNYNHNHIRSIANRIWVANRYAAVELEWISFRWLDKFLKIIFLFGRSCFGGDGVSGQSESSAGENIPPSDQSDEEAAPPAGKAEK
jgi:hypothetical protein